METKQHYVEIQYTKDVLRISEIPSYIGDNEHSGVSIDSFTTPDENNPHASHTSVSLSIKQIRALRDLLDNIINSQTTPKFEMGDKVYSRYDDRRKVGVIKSRTYDDTHEWWVYGCDYGNGYIHTESQHMLILSQDQFEEVGE